MHCDHLSFVLIITSCVQRNVCQTITEKRIEEIKSCLPTCDQSRKLLNTGFFISLAEDKRWSPLCSLFSFIHRMPSQWIPTLKVHVATEKAIGSQGVDTMFIWITKPVSYHKAVYLAEVLIFYAVSQKQYSSRPFSYGNLGLRTSAISRNFVDLISPDTNFSSDREVLLCDCMCLYLRRLRSIWDSSWMSSVSFWAILMASSLSLFSCSCTACLWTSSSRSRANWRSSSTCTTEHTHTHKHPVAKVASGIWPQCLEHSCRSATEPWQRHWARPLMQLYYMPGLCSALLSR